MKTPSDEPLNGSSGQTKKQTVTKPSANKKPAETTKKVPKAPQNAAEEETALAAQETAENAELPELTETPAPSAPSVSSVPSAPSASPVSRARSFFARILDRNGSEDAKSKKEHKKLMRKFRRSKDVPTGAEVERFSPPVEKGLTEEQVQLRNSQFLFNDVNKKYSKSYAAIFIGNLCTVFNFLCVAVAVALAIAGADLPQFLFVVIFTANLVIGIAQEILAKRQIDKLAVLISATAKVVRDGVKKEIPMKEIVLDDVLLLETGQQVPADCILAEGNVELNESLLTGESAAVKKQIGDTLYAGSFVSSGSCYVRTDKVGRNTYLNQLTSRAKKYKRPKSEIMNSIRLFIRVIGVMIPVVAALMLWTSLRSYGVPYSELDWESISNSIQYTGAVIIGMIPSGLLLLTSLAMAVGVRRLAKKQTLVQDMNSLEMLARVNVLCLDKTGTITDGRMTVSDCMIIANYTEHSMEEIMGSMLTALDDNNQTSIALQDRFGHSNSMQATALIPFSSKRKLSAVTFGDEGTFVFGAPEFVLRPMSPRIERIVKQYAQMGLRVLLLAYSQGKIVGDRLPGPFRPMALITLADNVRPEAVETIKSFKENDVDIRIISGDNPVTVSEVARRVGVANANKYISLDGLTDIEVENVANEYTVFGRVTPEQKAILVRTIKRAGNTVAMTGDGVNDILALKEADCAISVASGSEAARNVSHLVLMNNNFTNLNAVVNEGRRVINNIKNSASLYIMKTLFVTLLAVICVIMQEQYFFLPSHLLLFEFFVAAVPSFIISLQPNNSRVKGKFILYVLSRSIPGALTLIMCVLAVYFGKTYINGYGFKTNFQPMLILAVTFGGIVMLYRVLKPLNVIRSVLYGGCLAVCIIVLSVPLLSEIVYKGWSEVEFNLPQILYILVVILAAFPISGWLTAACDLMNSD